MLVGLSTAVTITAYIRIEYLTTSRGSATATGVQTLLVTAAPGLLCQGVFGLDHCSSGKPLAE